MNNTIVAFSIDKLYSEACNALVRDPDIVYPKNNKLFSEIIDATLVLHNPYDHVITIPERKLSLRYLFGEFAFYMKGSKELKDINKYSKFWNKISDDGKTVSSGYGYKLFGVKNDGMTQFDHAMYHLQKNPFSKRATMLINTPENSVMETKDTPCTMYLQFFIRDEKLHLINHMRSQDVFFGTPYDISFFTMLQELALVFLKEHTYPYLRMGTYSHHMGSFHLYAKDYEIIKSIANCDLNESYLFEVESMTTATLDQMQRFINVENGIAPENTVTDAFLKQALYFIEGGQ